MQRGAKKAAGTSEAKAKPKPEAVQTKINLGSLIGNAAAGKNDATEKLKKKEAERSKPAQYEAWPDEKLDAGRRYPGMRSVAQKWLGASGGTADIERFFSAAGNLQTKRRNRLRDHTSAMLLLLRSNMKLVEKIITHVAAKDLFSSEIPAASAGR